MRTNRFAKLVRMLVLCALPYVFLGFTPNGSPKIRISTSSQEARDLFLKGRDLQERLQGTESLKYFESAVARDPNFALAHLYSANSQPTAKGFFDELNKAVALVDKVSDGERLWILGVQAGADGQPMTQRDYFQKLVAAYPEDERAHNLLGNQYFGQQEFALAIDEFEKATAIEPNFSQPYNQLGYAYRSVENYKAAEKAFRKYIELIPNDPNPYDSYAELLLKMGRFDESIKQYKAALSYNEHFAASYIGMATDLCLLDKHAGARAQLGKLYSIARNDGERRAALFATAVTYVDEGKMDMALKELDKQFELAEKINDAAAKAGDLGAMGIVLLESGKYDEAMEKFEKSLKVTDDSKLSDAVKENAKRGFLYNAGRVALMKNDLATAKARSEEYLAQSMAAKNTFQIWLAHELAGTIALSEKNYDQAIEHLQDANQQNPYTLYRLALAYEGKGDANKAKELCAKAARFNALNNLNYAFMRMKAEQKLAALPKS